MTQKIPILFEFGDPKSELNIQRRLVWYRYVRKHINPGVEVVSRREIEADPMLQKALKEGLVRIAEGL